VGTAPIPPIFGSSTEPVEEASPVTDKRMFAARSVCWPAVRLFQRHRCPSERESPRHPRRYNLRRAEIDWLAEQLRNLSPDHVGGTRTIRDGDTTVASLNDMSNAKRHDARGMERYRELQKSVAELNLARGHNTTNLNI